MEAVKHILRYGTVGDQKDILAAQDTFDCLALNANMVSHAGPSIAKFIALEVKKKYFIDPLTYAFERNINLLYAKGSTEDERKPNFKQSIKKLVQSYSVFQEVLENNEPISLDVMKKEEQQIKLCKEVLDYQLKALKNSLAGSEIMEYLNFQGDENSCRILKSLEPIWVTPPYFYVDSTESDWLKINLELCNCFFEIKKQERIEQPLMVQILLDRKLLGYKKEIEKIAACYSQMECDGYLIWIDGLEEISATKEELEGYLQLLSGLGECPKYNLYGGYFSTILTSDELQLLSGVSHGLEYGESRRAFPVGGGIPSSKYYFLPLHQRLDFQTAFQILQKKRIIDTSKKDWGEVTKYFAQICRCEKCKEIIVDKMLDFQKYQSTEHYDVHYKTHTSRRIKAGKATRNNCRMHYLRCKRYEFFFVERRSLEDIIRDLEKTYIGYRESCQGKIDTGYLKQWRDILEKRS